MQIAQIVAGHAVSSANNNVGLAFSQLLFFFRMIVHSWQSSAMCDYAYRNLNLAMQIAVLGVDVCLDYAATVCLGYVLPMQFYILPTTVCYCVLYFRLNKASEGFVSQKYWPCQLLHLVIVLYNVDRNLFLRF